MKRFCLLWAGLFFRPHKTINLKPLSKRQLIAISTYIEIYVTFEYCVTILPLAYRPFDIFTDDCLSLLMSGAIIVNGLLLTGACCKWFSSNKKQFESKKVFLFSLCRRLCTFIQT